MTGLLVSQKPPRGRISLTAGSKTTRDRSVAPTQTNCTATSHENSTDHKFEPLARSGSACHYHGSYLSPRAQKSAAQEACKALSGGGDGFGGGDRRDGLDAPRDAQWRSTSATAGPPSTGAWASGLPERQRARRAQGADRNPPAAPVPRLSHKAAKPVASTKASALRPPRQLRPTCGGATSLRPRAADTLAGGTARCSLCAIGGRRLVPHHAPALASRAGPLVRAGSTRGGRK